MTMSSNCLFYRRSDRKIAILESEAQSLTRVLARMPRVDCTSAVTGNISTYVLSTTNSEQNVSALKTFKMASESPFVTLVSSDGHSFIVQRSSACISGAIKRMLDPSCIYHIIPHPLKPALTKFQMDSWKLRRTPCASTTSSKAPGDQQWRTQARQLTHRQRHRARKGVRVHVLQREA